MPNKGRVWMRKTEVMSPRRRCITARASALQPTCMLVMTTGSYVMSLSYSTLPAPPLLPADYRPLPAVFPRPAPFFANDGTEELLQVTPSLCSSP